MEWRGKPERSRKMMAYIKDIEYLLKQVAIWAALLLMKRFNTGIFFFFTWNLIPCFFCLALLVQQMLCPSHQSEFDDWHRNLTQLFNENSNVKLFLLFPTTLIKVNHCWQDSPQWHKTLLFVKESTFARKIDTQEMFLSWN